MTRVSVGAVMVAGTEFKGAQGRRLEPGNSFQREC